jgi:hypothetical protein
MATGPLNAIAQLVADVEELKHNVGQLVSTSEAMTAQLKVTSANVGRIAKTLGALADVLNDHESRLAALEGRAE